MLLTEKRQGMVKKMYLTEVSRKVDNIIENLQFSVKKEQVEDVFSKNEITDKTERIQLLRKCMQVLDTSNSDAPLSLDDEYNDELEIFLNGKWRLLL
jgi:hypothetical protein